MPHEEDIDDIYTQTQHIHLSEGWNLISFFVDLPFSHIKNMMESSETYPVKEIRSQAGIFRAFDNLTGITDIELERGYQVYCDQDFVWTIYGTERRYNIDIPINFGWTFTRSLPSP